MPPPIGLIGKVFVVVDILLMALSALTGVLVFLMVAVLSVIGAGVSWRAEPLLELFVSPLFLVLELTVVAPPLTAFAHVHRWRARWLVQAISLAPLAVLLLWLAIELR